jgi:hypothetical protein
MKKLILTTNHHLKKKGTRRRERYINIDDHARKAREEYKI